MSLAQAKHQLDTIIRKSRVHLYKPIQIAEILYQHRMGFPLAFHDLESYRNPSKKWRDDVTRQLVGRISTSSARFQDNLFEANAMPPEFLAELGVFNEQPEHSGIVEAYIYRSSGHRLGAISEVRRFVETATAETFRLRATPCSRPWSAPCASRSRSKSRTPIGRSSTTSGPSSPC